MTESVAVKIRDWALELLRRKRLMLAAVLASVLVVLLAAMLLLIGGTDRRRFESFLDQATDSYQAGNYDSALSLLRRAEGISHSDECLMLMADCYEAQGNLEKAVETLRQMDTSDSAVAQRITSLEHRRLRQESARMITVAGRQFSPDVQTLVLDGLELTDTALDAVKQLRQVDELSLRDNRLEDVSTLTEMSSLVTLDLSDNSVEDLSPLENLAGLRTLYLDNNPIKDLSPLYELDGLSFLSVLGLELSAEQLSELTQALPNCAIHTDAGKKDLVDITIGGVTFQSNVQELDLSGLGIRDIAALSACRELTYLNVSGNEISDLSALMELPSLERLNISDNQIGDLRPLMGLNTLRRLHAAGNRLTDTAAAGGIAGLTELDLSDNPLTDLSGLAKLESLRTLHLRGCGLDDERLEALKDLNGLTRMELEENPALSGEAVDELKSILYRCTISHSDLAYSVTVGDVRIRWDVSSLALSGMEISDISWISDFYSLENVDLSQNEISNLYIFLYCRSRGDIKTLNLSKNEIEDITALSALTALETLDLSGNRINAIGPLLGLKNLRWLDLSGNPLSREQLDQIYSALPDCQVIWEE